MGTVKSQRFSWKEWRSEMEAAMRGHWAKEVGETRPSPSGRFGAAVNAGDLCSIGVGDGP